MTPTRTLLPTLFLVSSLAACGGGGGSGSSGAPAETLDEGTFSQAEFSYVDPHPASFHPLGLESSTLTTRDELMILDVPEDPADARATMFDDIGVGAPVLGEVATLLGAGQYRAAASGNLDDDADEELVMVRILGNVLQVWILGRDASGAYVTETGFSIPSAGFAYGEARLTLGDVDGDHRDELLLVARKTENGLPTSDLWVRVYDDPVDGVGPLFEVDWPIFPLPLSNIADVRVTAADLDGDGRDELALLALHPSVLATTVHVRVLDDARAGFAQLVPWQELDTLFGPDSASARLLAGDFDGDDRDELALATWTFQGGGYESGVRTLELDGASLKSSAEKTVFGNLNAVFLLHPYRAWDAVAYDRDADGDDEVALLIPGDSFLPGNLTTMRWDGAGWQVDLTTDLPSFEIDDGAALVETDDDADGQEELYLCRMSGSSSSSTKARLVYRVDYGAPSGPITNAWTSTAQSSGRAYPPVLVAGDFDADGLAIRYTGREFTSLSDPKPIVVLTAAPTKAGISQKYDATSTSYVVTSGSSQSYGVSSGITASVYSGFAVSDLFDLFGVSARQTLQHAFTTSETQTLSQSVVQGFTGPHDQDAIVFEGTLYQSYEYEVLAAQDPTMVGTFFTFDVPVESRVYKWTVDYYNASVEPELRIGPDVLPHTIGDPSTYPARAAVEALVDNYVGWKTGDSPPMTVGQAGVSNSIAIVLAEESATETERTFAVDWELGFSSGGVELGGSFGLTGSEAYTVTVSQETAYEGVVGDIPLVSDYQTWRYEFGLAVYHRGLLADATNEPVAQEPGVLPYQVVTFWTNPTGSGY